MWVILAGVTLTVGGAFTTVVYFFQPWRTCPDDDAPDACPMLALDYQIMSVAMLITVIGVVVLAVGIIVQLTRASRGDAKNE